MAIATLHQKPISRYQARSAAPRRPAPPLPPGWVERGRALEMPPLSHFVLLSFLLHILAIALVGSPSGGSREGRALWGSLHVKLTPARPAAVPAPPVPAGTATADALPAPLPFPQLLDRIVTAEPKRDTMPRLKVPPPIQAQPAAPAPQVATPAPPILTPTPILVPSPTAAPSVTPRVAIPVPLPPQPASRPAYQTLVETPVILEAPAAPAPVIETPRVLLAPPTPQAERALVDAPRVLAAPAPLPAPAPESLVLPRAAEPPARPLDPALTSEIATPPPGTATAERTPRLDPATRIEREPPAKAEAEPVSPFRTPAPPAPRTGAADYDPTAPTLDAEAMRRRAASLAREGSGQRAILPFPMPGVPDKKNKIEDLLDKARKPDCRTAYQSLGLAAVIPLLANEIGEGTCRW